MKRSGVVLGPLPGFRTKAREKAEQLWLGSDSSCTVTQEARRDNTAKQAWVWGGEMGAWAEGEKQHKGQWERPAFSLSALLQLLKFFHLQGFGSMGELCGSSLCLSLQVLQCWEESGNTRCTQHSSCAHSHREARSHMPGAAPPLALLSSARGKTEGPSCWTLLPGAG